MKKTIENGYLNSVRWYALCDAITSLDKYKHGVSSMRFYNTISNFCEAVASADIQQEYIEGNTLGL